MLSNPAVYDRRYTASREGRQVTVCNPFADAFSLSGLIERAASGTTKGLYLTVRNPGALADAKAIVTRHLRVMHLDAWEMDAKPDAVMVRAAVVASIDGLRRIDA